MTVEPQVGSKYQSGEYERHNASWHVEDSPWKAAQILELVRRHDLKPRTVCEVGCGAGEILAQLRARLPGDVRFTGYDIAPGLEGFWSARADERLVFHRRDFLQTDDRFDLLLFVDVVEHVEDYIGFLRRAKARAEYKIFHFPLEIFALKALAGHSYVASRRKYGHIHYFNRDIVLALLEELDFEIVEHRYAPAAIELSATSTSISAPSRLLKLPRRLLSLLSVDLTAKALGGYTLFVLAK